MRKDLLALAVAAVLCGVLCLCVGYTKTAAFAIGCAFVAVLRARTVDRGAP
jgi:hypothetical protein